MLAKTYDVKLNHMFQKRGYKELQEILEQGKTDPPLTIPVEEKLRKTKRVFRDSQFGNVLPIELNIPTLSKLSLLYSRLRHPVAGVLEHSEWNNRSCNPEHYWKKNSMIRGREN